MPKLRVVGDQVVIELSRQEIEEAVEERARRFLTAHQFVEGEGEGSGPAENHCKSIKIDGLHRTGVVVFEGEADSGD
jgi:hypothetical protein